MPAVSKNEQIAAAIAKHHPSQLYARNRSLLGMSDEQLEDFARTRRTGLPQSKALAKGLKKAKA